MKSAAEWRDEAGSFIFNYQNATGRLPDLQDTIEDCKKSEKSEEYARELYMYMLEAYQGI